MRQYHTLFIDALQRMDRRGGNDRLERLADMPSAACVPFEITPLVPLIDDFFHSHLTFSNDHYALMEADKLPPVVVPYPETWWEWMGSGAGPRMTVSEEILNYAIHVRSFDSKDIEAAHLIEIAEKGSHLADPLIRKLYAESRWVFDMNLWIAGPLRTDDFAVMTLTGSCAVAEDGTVSRQFFDDGDGLTDPSGIRENRRGLTGLFAGVLFAMGLLNCKGVEQEAVDPPPALSKKRVRHGHLPLVRYHTLRIRVPGTKRYVDLNAIRTMRENPVPFGLHYVRGHFKTYTAERPLLGRAVGTFYWPPCLKGKASAGVIGKTYVEEPSKGDHDENRRTEDPERADQPDAPSDAAGDAGPDAVRDREF